MRRNGAVPLVADPFDGGSDRFIGDGHCVRICMDECIRIDDQRHVPLPKYQIVPLIRACRGGSDTLLLITIPGTGDGAGQEGGLDEPGTINAFPAVATPKIGCSQKECADGGGICGIGINLCQMGQRHKTSVDLCKFFCLARDLQLAAET